jgi:hypothetical protein
MSESKDSIPKKRLNKWQVLLLFIVGLVVFSFFLAPKSNSPTPSSPKIDNVQTKKKIEGNSAQVTPTEKPLPTFDMGSFGNFMFCNSSSNLGETVKIISDIKSGLASKKDLIKPLKEIASDLEFSRDYLQENDSSKYSPDGSEWSTKKNVDIEEWLPKGDRDNVVKQLNSFYEWYAKTRVRLMDRGVVSANEILLKNKQVEDFVSTYCEKK